METQDVTWRNALVQQNATIEDVVRSLNDNALRIVVVVNGAGVLQGTVSDGDIRRGLLKGLTLASSIRSIVRTDPLVVHPGMSRNSILKLMTVNKVQQIPVVDDDYKVVDLHVWDELTVTQEKENVIVIMAGGKGTRLRPHTENCPKPLVEVAGKPMLEHIIERCKADGFTRFIIAIHYLGYMIEDYFGDGANWGVRIDYLREELPLGTAGALSLLDPVPELPFIVTNGDVITDIRYGELLDFHIRHEAAATMAVRLHEWQHPFGVVQTSGIEIVGFEEKPVSRSHINAGVYVLSPETLKHVHEGEPCDMPTLFERVKMTKSLAAAYPMYEPWMDVGRPTDLAEANKIHE